MKSISIVSKHIMHIMGISWAYHGKKTEFLNSFVSLTSKHIMRIIFTCVCLSNYLAFFKDNKIIRGPARRKVDSNMQKKSRVVEDSHQDPEIGVVEEFIERNEGPPERLESPEKHTAESPTLNPQARVREILKRSAVWWPWWEGRSK